MDVIVSEVVSAVVFGVFSTVSILRFTSSTKVEGSKYKELIEQSQEARWTAADQLEAIKLDVELKRKLALGLINVNQAKSDFEPPKYLAEPFSLAPIERMDPLEVAAMDIKAYALRRRQLDPDVRPLTDTETVTMFAWDEIHAIERAIGVPETPKPQGWEKRLMQL